MHITQPKKVIVIGIDGLIPEFVIKFMREGILSNIQRLMQNGVFSELLPAVYTETPTNWTTIATGTWPGTHGINSFGFHIQGEPFDKVYDVRDNFFPVVANVNTKYFMNRLCRAEYIWQTAEEVGKKVILVNWPGGWPPNIKKGVVVDGTGPYSSPVSRMSHSAIFSSSPDRGEKQTNKLCVIQTKGWKNSPPSFCALLETALYVTGEADLKLRGKDWVIDEKHLPHQTALSLVYNLLLVASSKNKGYDRVIVSKDKDASKPIAVLNKGEESDWIIDEFRPTIGEQIYANMIIRSEIKAKIKGKFKLRLAEISRDGKEITIERTPIFAVENWAYPERVVHELIDDAMMMEKSFRLNNKSRGKLITQKSPLCQVYESVEDMAQGIARTCVFITKKYDWDFLFTQIHAPDGLNHDELNNICPDSPTYEASKVEESWDKFRKTYRVLDNMIGEIVSECGNSETLVVIVSDHGGIPTKKRVSLEVFFQREELLRFKENERGRLVIDFSKSKIVHGINYVTHNIWVNLKGRDPQGIIEPEEYEEVRERIIDILHSIKDPETGQRPIALALRKEEAADFGHWGDRMGDVIYLYREGYSNKFTNCITGIIPEDLPENGFETVLEGPEFGRHHSYLPSTKYCGCSIRTVFIMSGRGVRRNYVRSFPIRTVDVAPTISFLTGIPYPAQSEGMVFGDAIDTRIHKNQSQL